MPTFLSILALIIALVAVAYAWKLQQELSTATRRLDRYNRAIFDANDELRSLRADMEQSSAALRVEIMRAGGALRVTPETTMQEVELMHPQVGQVLAAFHVGGCSDCSVAPTDTMAQLCVARDLPLETLLANLNQLVEVGNANPGAPLPLKIPNMVLEFS